MHPVDNLVLVQVEVHELAVVQVATHLVVGVAMGVEPGGGVPAVADGGAVDPRAARGQRAAHLHVAVVDLAPQLALHAAHARGRGARHQGRRRAAAVSGRPGAAQRRRARCLDPEVRGRRRGLRRKGSLADILASEFVPVGQK